MRNSLVSALVLTRLAAGLPLYDDITALTALLSDVTLTDTTPAVSAAPTVESTWQFIKQLQSSSSACHVGSGPCRAPFLAELLLEFTVLQVPTRYVHATLTAHHTSECYGRFRAVHGPLSACMSC